MRRFFYLYSLLDSCEFTRLLTLIGHGRTSCIDCDPSSWTSDLLGADTCTTCVRGEVSEMKGKDGCNKCIAAPTTKLDGKYSKRRRSNVAVIIVRVVLISSY